MAGRATQGRGARNRDRHGSPVTRQELVWELAACRAGLAEGRYDDGSRYGRAFAHRTLTETEYVESRIREIEHTLEKE